MEAAKLVDRRGKERIRATWFKVDTRDVGLFGRIYHAEFRLRADESGAIESLAKTEIFAVVDSRFIFAKVDDQRGAAIRQSALFCVPGGFAFVNPE